MKRFIKMTCLICILSLCAACGGTENAEGSHGKEAPAFTDSLTKDGTGIAHQAEAASDMVEYYKTDTSNWRRILPISAGMTAVR